MNNSAYDTHLFLSDTKDKIKLSLLPRCPFFVKWHHAFFWAYPVVFRDDGTVSDFHLLALSNTYPCVEWLHTDLELNTYEIILHPKNVPNIDILYTNAATNKVDWVAYEIARTKFFEWFQNYI